jgi:quercetin dioxygenase-like cupin family protein
MKPKIVDWGDIPSERASETVQKQRIPGAVAELVRVEIRAGTRAGRHSHPHEQFVQEAGTLEFRPGTVFHFPPDAWHAAEFYTDTVFVETNLNQR